MTVLPKSIGIIETGPRDGLQSEAIGLTPAMRAGLVQDLFACGLEHVQAVSFVSPKRVPQMAGADEVLRRLDEKDRRRCSALVLNEKGLDLALAAGIRQVDLSISTSDRHSRKNTGMSLAEAEPALIRMIDRAHSAGLRVRAGLQNVFGCREAGQPQAELLRRLIRRLAGSGVAQISLADSSGMGWPALIERVTRELREAAGPDLPFILHLHDTRGLAMANIMAGMASGVRLFDASVGGTGGCPFIRDAAGNPATEDLVALCDSSGIRTGVDAEKLARCATRLGEMLQRQLPGRYHRLRAAGVKPSFFKGEGSP